MRRTLLACVLAGTLAATAAGGLAPDTPAPSADPAQVAQFVRMAAAQHITPADVRPLPNGALVATGLATCLYVKGVVGCSVPSIAGLELRASDGRVFRQYP